MATPTLAERRNEIEDALLEHADKLRDLRSKPADQRGDTFESDYRNAARAVTHLDAEFTALERLIKAEERNSAPEPVGPEAAFALSGMERRTVGDHVILDPAFGEWRDAGGGSSRFPNIEIRASLLDPEFRALVTSLTTDTPAAGVLLPAGQPITPIPRQRRAFLRDLLSVQGTGLASVPYVREVSPLANEGGASAVAEGSAKPEVTVQFEADDAPVRKIAAWLPITDEVLADAATLRGYIDTRLAYMLMIREEDEVLNGNGTAPRIKGIRTFTIQTQAEVTGDYPATIGRAISKVENVDGEADGVVCNTLDFWVAVTARHANQFDNGFGGNAPAAMSGITWGLPAVRTRAIESGKALVGSFRLGATLFDREQTNIRTSDSHDDYFVKNKIAILAEERVALAVHRPDFFVEASVPTT